MRRDDHDDAEREYAYASEAVTDAEPSLEAAFGWTVVSIRRLERRVFA